MPAEFKVGQQVKAVRNPQAMEAEPEFIGRVGTITGVIKDALGVYFVVEFDRYGVAVEDSIDAAGLEAV